MLTLLIPSRTDRLLDRLLSSLREAAPHSLYQVVVADNGLTRGFAATYPHVRFVKIADPFCFSHAVNAAAAYAAPGNDIFIMNDDIVVESKDFISQMEATLQEGKRFGYGILSPMTRGGVGNSDQAWELESTEIRTTYGTVCFIAAAIPRFVWDRVGGLDERFTGYGCEDVDYSRRVVEAGWRLGVTGAGTIRHGDGIHPFSATFRRRFGQRKLGQMSDHGGKIFEEKWGPARMGRYAELGSTSTDKYQPIPDVPGPIAAYWDPVPEAAFDESTPQMLMRATLLKQAGPVPRHVLKYGQDTDIEADIDLLWACARVSVPRIAVELGTREGISTRAIMDAIRGRGCRLFTVDPDPSCKRFVSGMVHCKFIRQYGEQFLAAFKEKIDFMFVDTDPHTAEQTRTWLDLIESVMSPTGCVAFHDIIENRPEIGVARAVREWVKNRPEWSWTEFPVRPAAYRWPQGGLGLLRRA